MNFDVKFDNSNKDITVQMSGDTSYTVNMGTSSSGTTDHNKLKNRDAENQHPIAITDLEKELSEKLEEEDLEEFSNLDIIKLWNSI